MSPTGFPRTLFLKHARIVEDADHHTAIGLKPHWLPRPGLQHVALSLPSFASALLIRAELPDVPVCPPPPALAHRPIRGRTVCIHLLVLVKRLVIVGSQPLSVDPGRQRPLSLRYEGVYHAAVSHDMASKRW
ncbi:MAG: hypothetical protein BJ554DRAFT_4032 [Olpidium bornovanus]|uniref:Uncharacterized protein n=1 Tax=Olpidium bornovanus TaxID=278681 RepID=A0A8H7ZNR1_9FUNG|nr:MAG: hypothetical protein BJ554DRAFT_4032 [Olpidium bornovanus]